MDWILRYIKTYLFYLSLDMTEWVDDVSQWPSVWLYGCIYIHFINTQGVYTKEALKS